MGKIQIFLYQLFFIIYLIVYGFISIYTIWTSTLWKALFYICFILLIIISIYAIINIFLAFNLKPLFIINHLTCFKYMISSFKIVQVILIIVLSSLKIINSFNNDNYEIYTKNCPFTFHSVLKSFNESIYEKKRCELYNINMNSRYKYQYICSYNASKIFENDKTKDGFDKIICIPKINDIDDNENIIRFNKIYKHKDKNDSDLFYCSRIDKPEKDEYIKEKYCNIEIKIPTIIFYLFSFIHFFNSLHQFIFSNLNDALSNRTHNIVEGVRQVINILHDKEDCDTEYDESSPNNVSFNEEEDKNIIFENHIISDVTINIKDFIENEGKPKLD